MGKLIDLDDLKNEYQQRIDYLLNEANEPALAGAAKGCMDIAELLIPTVDAVPVIRCKDCIHFLQYTKNAGDCNIWENETKACDFCSYAEPLPKEENHETD